MKTLYWFFPLILLFFIMPAAAQGEQCLEIWELWSDEVRHEVNLDTGRVTSYAAPIAGSIYSGVDSPNGRYNAILESQEGLRENELVLTDHDRGVSIVLAENASSLTWSPDGVWLTYIQWDEDARYLTLYNMDSGERISTRLPESEWGGPHLEWSPDGSLITAVVADPDPVLGRSEVQFYSVPDLARVNTFETTLNRPEAQWSPSGRYLAAYGSNNEVALFDIASAQVYTWTLYPPSLYRFFWSPDESFLLIEHAASDSTDEINIVNMQGELVLQNVIVKTFNWLSDHQLLASVWRSSGFRDLTVFDLQTGEQRVIQQRLASYRLSPDSRYVAVIPTGTWNSERSYLMRIFDLSLQRTAPIRTLSLNMPLDNFIWREDRLELIVLFADRSLRGYDFEAGGWRSIASIPGDEIGMRPVACVH